MKLITKTKGVLKMENQKNEIHGFADPQDTEEQRKAKEKKRVETAARIRDTSLNTQQDSRDEEKGEEHFSCGGCIRG